VSARAAGWLSFAVLVLAMPFPAIGPFGGFVAPVHHVVLCAATGAIAAAEGVAGPVGQILLLFAINAVATLFACGLASWLAARLLAPLAPRTRAWVVGAVGAALFAVAIAFPLYETPFGRTPTSNWFGLF
jgi:hypothetical protein